MIEQLRIGNWANFTFMNLTEQYTVHEIRQDKILITDDISYQPSMVSPIPLTEQFLIDFGAKHSHNQGTHYWIQATLNTQIEFIITDDGIYPILVMETESLNEDCQEIHLNKLEYVHSFQNLYFALTGTELTLKTEGK